MHLWDDPPETCQKEFKHGPWLGMPPRHVWNASPNLRPCQTCLSCGYKWDEIDFTYAAHPSQPVERHTICWNCYMLEIQPEKIRSVWEERDRDKAGTVTKRQNGFKKAEQL